MNAYIGPTIIEIELASFRRSSPGGSMKTRIGAIFVLLTAATFAAHAQATRTWVSGVGDDVNPCSRTAPCKTWAGAISKTGPGGEIDALDPGGFGAVTITKAITLDGGGGQVASILVAGTNGIIVAAGAGDNVIIRNLRLNGINQSISPGVNGIRFQSGKSLIVENCIIFGMGQAGIDIESTTAASVYVTGSSSNNNTGPGFKSINTAAVKVTIDRSNFLNNNNFGIQAADNTDMSVFRSDASGNGIGILVQASTGGPAATGRVSETIVANNSIGMQAGGNVNGTSLLQIGHNYIFGNPVGLLAGQFGTINTGGENLNTGTGVTSGAGGITVQ